MDPMVVRRMRFAYPDDVDPVFVAKDPEFAFVATALSLALPYLEPYLIRTMKQAELLVDDSRLRADLRGFVLQEGQHYQQHKRFNELLHARGLVRLQALESSLASDYERFSNGHSLAFNLAYAEGFEALTTAMAMRFLELDRGSWDPDVLELFEWHLVEEIEHRTVAFEVYEHVVGDYRTRVRVGAFAQRHLVTFIWRATSLMLESSPEQIERLGGVWAHRRRTVRLFRTFFAPIVPRVVATHLPWYCPRKVELPPTFPALAAHYTERAERAFPVDTAAS